MSAKLAELEVPSPRRFSRGWWAERLRTFGWVAVITLLIWVYADITKTEEKDIDLSLQMQAASADNMVLLSPTEDISIRARVRGRRDAIDRLTSNKLLYDASKLAPKTTELDAAALLWGLPEVRNAGVTILNARPETIAIELAALVRTQARVSLRTTGGEATEVKFEPEMIALLVPDTYKDQVEKDSYRLPTTNVDLRDRPTDKLNRIEGLQVRTPDIPGCRLETNTVNVSFKVGRQIVPKKFNVALNVQSPHTWLSDDTWIQYKLEIKGPELTRQITVKGNQIDLEKLRSEDIHAYITLTEDDKRAPGSWITGQVQIQFRRGLQMQVKDLEVVDIPSVEYRLVERPKAPPAP